jgi:hypothetical protein
MDWLRINTANNPNARAILSRNPGIGPDGAAHWRYVGFKGGSEPGVITLNYLVETRSGEWLAVTGNWHNPKAAVSTLTFAALMNRALLLAAQGASSR